MKRKEEGVFTRLGENVVEGPDVAIDGGADEVRDRLGALRKARLGVLFEVLRPVAAVQG